VDGVALASVITSGVVAIATSGWTGRQSAKRARETRLAESYLEVLRIVEREGQRVEASITNWKLAAEEAEFEPNPGLRDYVPGFERVKVPEPAVTGRATAAAHLAAFGSANVRRLYQAWRSTIAAIDTELDELHRDESMGGPSLDEVKHLQDVLHPNERGARQALADTIADQLSHR
jgi:hypothetical protein